ncbi:hypothetical protein BC938DRAFT_476765 [Jimgerdemannia flammicorona]|uniref:Uncharacterized protein n=1 Tax=Jimgerdemannia flammicorona TaxID=994334 RepID=A0A433QQ81_9FUNG|nr:hypothetical protein BC938DRAFT_476765 [Jimgerdemannia flammicorona]
MLDVTEEGLDKFNSDDEVNWDAKQVFEYRDEMRKRPKIDVEANEQETGDGKNDNLLVDDDMPLVSGEWSGVILVCFAKLGIFQWSITHIPRSQSAA